MCSWRVDDVSELGITQILSAYFVLSQIPIFSSPTFDG